MATYPLNTIDDLMTVASAISGSKLPKKITLELLESGPHYDARIYYDFATVYGICEGYLQFKTKLPDSVREMRVEDSNGEIFTVIIPEEN